MSSEWDLIVNPETGRKCSIYGEKGQQIISNYLQQVGSGKNEIVYFIQVIMKYRTFGQNAIMYNVDELTTKYKEINVIKKEAKHVRGASSDYDLFYMSFNGNKKKEFITQLVRSIMVSRDIRSITVGTVLNNGQEKTIDNVNMNTPYNKYVFKG